MVWWRALEEEATAYYITYILSLFIAYDNLHLSTSPFAQIESGKLGSTFGIRRKNKQEKISAHISMSASIKFRVD